MSQAAAVSTLRFSRDDEQLIALTFENLCDEGYLQRLFVGPGEAAGGGTGSALDGSASASQNNEALVSGRGTGSQQAATQTSQQQQPPQLTQSQQQQQQQQQHSPSQSSHVGVEGWTMTADMAEDVILFGNAIELGRDFQERRFIRDVSMLHKSQDALAGIVHKQILVFEHIGRLMLERCAMPAPKGASPSSSSSAVTSRKAPTVASPPEQGVMAGLATDALLCAVRVLESQSRLNIRLATVEPLLSLVMNLFKSLSLSPAQAEAATGQRLASGQIPRQHVHFLRSMLCSGLCKLSRESSRLVQSGTKEADGYREELLRLALTCAYGLLSIGLYSDNVGDVLVAVTSLMAISVQTDEWVEETAVPQQQQHKEEGAAADSPKKMSILARRAEKEKEKGEDAPWGPAGPSLRPSSGNNQVFLEHDYETSRGRGDEEEEPALLGGQQRGKSSWDKAAAAAAAAAGLSSASVPALPAASALKVVLDKDAKSRIRLVKSRWGGDGSPATSTPHPPYSADEHATVGFVMGPQHGYHHQPHQNQQQQQHGLKEHAKSTGVASQKGPFAKGASNADDRLQAAVPGRPAFSKAAAASAASASSAAHGQQHRPKTPKPLNEVIAGLTRIPKSVLSVVQECSVRLRAGSGLLSREALGTAPRAGKRSPVPAAFTGESYVWTCGQNSYGELGHGDASQRRVFSKTQFLDGKSVVSIGAGNEHSVFVAKTGEVFVCGYNDNGQCGLGTTQQVRQLSQVASLEGEEIVQVHIYNGCEHTMAVSRDGKLFAFGYNYRGQLGLGTTVSEASPRPVKSLLSRRVMLVACSYHHSMMLCSDGSLFSVGRNDCGQLGHGDSVDKKVPHPVQGCPRGVVGVSCGQFHTIASTSAGTAFVCGKNDYGQLGFESPDNVRLLSPLPHDIGLGGVVQVCSGYYHTLMLLQSGAVVGFGRNDYGQLGLGHAQPRVCGAHVVASLRDKNVVTVNAGCYHSITVTANGMLYVFGRNNHGQLGTGDLEERHLPHPVDDFVGQRVLQVAAGFYHTIVLTVDAQGDADAVSEALTKDERLFSSLLGSPVEVDADEGEAAGAAAPCLEALLCGNAAVNPQDSPVARGKGDASKVSSAGDFPASASNLLPAAAQQSIGSSRSRGSSIRDLLSFLVGHLDSLARKELSEASGSGSALSATDGAPASAPAGAAGAAVDSAAGRRSLCRSLLPLLSSDASPSSWLSSAEWKGHQRDVSWLCRQIRCVTLLLSVMRQSYSSGVALAQQPDFPISPDDAMPLVRTLVRVADVLLKQYGRELSLLYVLDSDAPDGGASLPVSVQPSSPTPITAAFMTDFVHKMCSEVFFAAAPPDAQDEPDDKAQGAQSVGATVRSCVDGLRQELLQVYLYLPEDLFDSAGGASASPDKNQRQQQPPSSFAVREVASTITQYFERLFPTAALRSSFFSLLGGILTSNSSVDDDAQRNGPDREPPQPDFGRCLRLFSRVCFKFRGIQEVVRLFRSSHFHGLVVFQQLLAVHSTLSQRTLDQRLKQIGGDAPLSERGDIVRTAGVLEHCNAIFVKCAVPVIFSLPSPGALPAAASSPTAAAGRCDEPASVAAFGLTLLRDVLSSSVNAISLTMQQPLSEELLALTRSGSVIPNVLPTILMLAVGFAKSSPCCCAQDLQLQLTALIHKLQEFGRFEQDLASLSPSQQPGSAFLSSGAAAAASSATSLASPMVPASAAQARKMGRGGDASPSLSSKPVPSAAAGGAVVGIVPTLSLSIPPSASSPLSPFAEAETRRDVLQTTWWTRLLKLAVLLQTHLATALLAPASLSSPASPDQPSTEANQAIVSEAEGLSVTRAALWRYLSNPMQSDLLRSYASLLAKDAESGLLTVTTPRDGLSSSGPATQQQPQQQQQQQQQPQPTPRPGSAMFNVSIHSVLTPIRPAVRRICTELRQREMIKDHTYRALCLARGAENAANQSSSAAGGGGASARRTANAYLESIEQMLLDVIVHVDGSSLVDFATLCVTPGAARGSKVSTALSVSAAPSALAASDGGQGQEAAPRLASQSKHSNRRLCRMWTCVAKLTKLLHRRRTTFMAGSASAAPDQVGGSSWLEITMQLHKLVGVIREALLRAQPLMTYNIRPLPVLPASQCALSKAKLAFRRCALVVLSAVRWQACCRAKAGGNYVGDSVVQFFASVIEISTKGFATVDDAVMRGSWLGVVRCLEQSNIHVSQYTRGLQQISALLRESCFTSSINDVLAALASAWRASLVQSSSNSSLRGDVGSTPQDGLSPSCCSVLVLAERRHALDGLVQFLVGIVTEHSKRSALGSCESPSSVNEINQLTLAVRLLHLYFLKRRDGVRGLPAPLTPAKLGALLLALVTDGSRGLGSSEMLSSAEDKPEAQSSSLSPLPSTSASVAGGSSQTAAAAAAAAASVKRAAYSKDRSRSLRRAANGVVSFLQELSAGAASSSASGGGASAALAGDQLLHTLCALLSHFQSSRLAASRVDADGGYLTSSMSSGRVGGDASKAGPGAGNGVGAGALPKRRCQELITKPMEFCRAQEGLVVQGDKLLNNYKGMDFTLATWVLVTKKLASTRQSFITGKVSHNDAWPLVSLKPDGRLEVLFGHGNEFERFTSQAALGLFNWTHVAVVVEPKKIKLFINGMLDSQANTKGNGRAILYPVVVGTCPAGVRTRVDFVREGFDGLLACYKYYTRALSPIHVRVVFDQGPPESFDAVERWMYQLLAPTRVLSASLGAAASADTLLLLASTLLMVVSTDTTGRLRSAALVVLKDVLMLDALSDMSLTSCRILAVDASLSGADVDAAASLYSSCQIGSCSFLSGVDVEASEGAGAVGDTVKENFRRRVVLYLLRLLGCCWLPSLTALADDATLSSDPRFLYKQSLEHLLQATTAQPDGKLDCNSDAAHWAAFLDYAPAFLSDQPSALDGAVPAPVLGVASAGDKQALRADAANELSAHLRDALLTLSCQQQWRNSITAVLLLLLKRAAESFAPPNLRAEAEFEIPVTAERLRSQQGLADALGVACFLGGFSAGPHAGTDVETFFGDSVGRVLSVNKIINFAAVLSWNNAGTARQLSTVRVADLVGRSVPALPLTPPLLGACVSLLSTLQPYTLVPLSDLLALFRPDHTYCKHILLKASRPVELFLYSQLLQGVCGEPEVLSSAGEDVQRALVSLLQPAAARALRLQASSEDLSANRAFPSLWAQCARHLYLLPDDVIGAEYPPAEGERQFADYLAKHMGVASEAFQNPLHERILRQGQIIELVLGVAAGSSAGSAGAAASPPAEAKELLAGSLQSMLLSPDGIFCVTDWLGYVTGTGSASAGVAGAGFGGMGAADTDVSEPEALCLLRILFQLRRNIVLISRKALLSLAVPRDLLVVRDEKRTSPSSLSLLMLSLLSSSQQSACLSLRAGLQPARAEVTQRLAASIRYASISLLNLSSSKSSGNILESTDVLARLIHAAVAWIDLHRGGDYELELSFQLARMLLPSLSFVESAEVELQIMKVCRLALSRLVAAALGDGLHGSTKDVLELARSNNFTLLRARAQEELAKHNGKAGSQHSSVAFNLNQIAAGLEILQRAGRSPSTAPSLPAASLASRVTGIVVEEVPVAPVGASSPRAGAPLGRSPRVRAGSVGEFGSPAPRISAEDEALGAIVTSAPRIVNTRFNSVDADLAPCAASAAMAAPVAPAATAAGAVAAGAGSDAAALSTPLKGAAASPSVSSTPGSSVSSGYGEQPTILVEAALGVVCEGDEETVFETVYCGSSLRFVQSGLATGCTYQIRCRAVVGGVCLQWSPAVTFHTEQGVPFTFDPIRRGPDIILSDDGLTASYAGDDSWSTLFGTQSFSTGVTSWEIRVAQSSTAYVFVGVARSSADLNTFLGGCPNGWGFIGEQALYHNREKVKIYGESFSAGDIVGVVLDLNHGTLSFTRNGKMLGVAFDKLYGEMFPAVAFYNVGQELEIIVDSFQTTCPAAPVPCSPCRLLTSDVGVAAELMQCLTARCPLSPRMLAMVAERCNEWVSGTHRRFRSASGLMVLLDTSSPLLRKFGLVAGERVRTPVGVATVAGALHGRVWFVMNEQGHVWFFSGQQILHGRENGLFLRCTYETSSTDGSGTAANSTSLLEEGANAAFASTPTPFSPSSTSFPDDPTNASTLRPSTAVAPFEAASLSELLHPSKWSPELDAALVQHLIQCSDAATAAAAAAGGGGAAGGGVGDSACPWTVAASFVQSNFRSLQQTLGRIVRADERLAHRWGLAGPKRRAVLARLGLLRWFNCLLDQHLPVFLDGPSPREILGGESTLQTQWGGADLSRPATTVPLEFPNHRFSDDFHPSVLTLTEPGKRQGQGQGQGQAVAGADAVVSARDSPAASLSAPRSSSAALTLSAAAPWSACSNVIAPLRSVIFPDTKTAHFWDVVSRSAARSAKTDDDYDYPEDLPQIKINRLKSFRAREAAELQGVPGEDLFHASMFWQLWQELRKHPSDRLRAAYTHPMDDGQARVFKIRFEGEGVDDYGGPYREIFQQICDELQAPDPSASASASTGRAAVADSNAGAGGGERVPVRCLLPLLHPTPNWAAGDCEERYCFVFHPAARCDVRKDHFRFLGQFVGVALRSRITLSLALPSVTWKSIVREPLGAADLASFDMPSFKFVQHLQGALDQSQAAAAAASAASESSSSSSSTAAAAAAAAAAEVEEALRDVNWTATRCDGRTVELVPGGSSRPVLAAELELFLSTYISNRLSELALATECFREGLLSVIPESALSVFTWQELRLLVNGSRGVDVARLRENTEYDDDVTPEDSHISAFWQVLQDDFSDEEKAAFLRFVWARPTLPPPGVPFPQKMKIQSAVGDDATLKPDQYLPRAHTCFFSINLPRYSGKEILAERLRYAIANCTEMDADFRVTEADVAGWAVPTAPARQQFPDED